MKSRNDNQPNKQGSSTEGASRRQFFKFATSAGIVAGAVATSEDAFAIKLPGPRATPKKFLGGKFPKGATLAKGRVVGANDRVMLAHVGLGGMGTSHIKDFSEHQKEYNSQPIAVCDAYRVRLDRAKNIVAENNKGCANVQAESDYRKVLENKDIDAVLIATPEHWHSEIAVHAMEAGKHVYIEKPMSRYLDEAFQIYDAHKRTGRLVQVGAQGCSEPQTHEARKILNDKKLGPLVSVQTSYCRNSKEGEWNYKIDEEAGPDNIDWEMWLVSAQKRKWDDESKSRFFRYRKYRDYSAGILGDLMPHRIYPTLFAVGSNEFPKRVTCMGTRQVSTDREVADTVNVVA